MGRQTGRRRRGDEYKRKGEGSGCEVSFFPFLFFFLKIQKINRFHLFGSSEEALLDFCLSVG